MACSEPLENKQKRTSIALKITLRGLMHETEIKPCCWKDNDLQWHRGFYLIKEFVVVKFSNMLFKVIFEIRLVYYPLLQCHCCRKSCILSSVWLIVHFDVGSVGLCACASEDLSNALAHVESHYLDVCVLDDRV